MHGLHADDLRGWESDVKLWCSDDLSLKTEEDVADVGTHTNSPTQHPRNARHPYHMINNIPRRSLPRYLQLSAVSKIYFPATQGVESTVQLLAKAHVVVHVSHYRQLINHR